MKRRDFLKFGTVVGGSSFWGANWTKNLAAKNTHQAIHGTKDLHFPIRQITSGPGLHWFGYYDKLQFDPTSRYALGMRVDFDRRTPKPNDQIEIGLIDLEDNDQWQKLGTSTAWCWQQGCMLQWIPGSSTEVIWNDRDNDRYVSRIYDMKTKKIRTLPKPIYSLSPDGAWAIGTDFSRIDMLRPGYGYVGVPDPYADVKAPEKSGIDRIDLRTGEHRQIVSLAEIAALPHQGQDVRDHFHWFNPLLVNTDGTRITFLHRWRKERTDRQVMARLGWTTRMLTLSPEGRNPYIINDSGAISHFVWADPKTICAFVQPPEKPWRLYFLEDGTGKMIPIGHDKITRDGHVTMFPGGKKEWILNDSYPDRKERLQSLYLYHIPTDSKYDIGRFYEPAEYAAEWRVDLHARTSPDGKKIIIDSTHSGERQMWLIDLSNFSMNC